MKKITVIGIGMIFCYLSVSAQVERTFFIGLGGGGSTFQDVKFSTNQYRGTGGIFDFGYTRQRVHSKLAAYCAINFGSESAATHDKGNTFVLNPRLGVQYLRNIQSKFWLGGRWNIMDLYIRNIDGLGNNSVYYIGSSQLFLSGEYEYQKFNFGCALGLLAFQKESTSFAFSAPQNGLEDGEFGYQNEALDDLFGFKYYQFKPIWQQLSLRTHVIYNLNERINIGYQWQMRRFAEVENYPVTYGIHSVVIRFNIVRKGTIAPLNE